MKLKIIDSIAHPSPPWTKLGKKIESLCRKAIHEFNLWPQDNKIAIALSGGKDSLTLLYLLKALSNRGFPPLDITAIHVSGMFSCGAGVDLSFLEKTCSSLQIPLIILSSEQKKENLECYSCSRDRRSLIFKEALKRKINTVAFGHHKDDCLQTLIMNLLHKGEFAGNLPKVFMQHYGVTIVRPLFYVGENEIKEFAKLYGFNRITCQCPVGQKSMRQKAKNTLKFLEEEFPQSSQNLFSSVLKYGSKKALKP
ncbi:MAG: tRNA lysidine(34) synthetase [Rhabdochlamydiaceae bacterium]